MDHPITIEQTLLRSGDACLVLANDPQHRSMVGVSHRSSESGLPAFVQIDRVTMLELQRGILDLRTAIEERCAGIAVSAAALR